MNDNPSSLSDDELWARCQKGGPITSQDLGLDSSQNSSDGTTYFTEGTNYFQYELNNHNKK